MAMENLAIEKMAMEKMALYLNGHGTFDHGKLAMYVNGDGKFGSGEIGHEKKAIERLAMEIIVMEINNGHRNKFYLDFIHIVYIENKNKSFLPKTSTKR